MCHPDCEGMIENHLRQHLQLFNKNTPHLLASFYPPQYHFFKRIAAKKKIENWKLPWPWWQNVMWSKWKLRTSFTCSEVYWWYSLSLSSRASAQTFHGGTQYSLVGLKVSVSPNCTFITLATMTGPSAPTPEMKEYRSAQTELPDPTLAVRDTEVVATPSNLKEKSYP